MKATGRFMKKLKFFTLMTILIVLTLSAFIAGYGLRQRNKEYNTLPLSPEKESSELSFKLKESIIQGISNKMELITLEADLTEKIIIDESWGELSLFKKIKNIQYFGKGSYGVDLSKISNETIKVDSNSKSISISLSKPFIKDCSLLEEKTLYESTENGFLRFGEISLTLEEESLLRQRILERMKKRMEEEELHQKAIEHSKTIIESLVKELSSPLLSETYTIKIQFQ